MRDREPVEDPPQPALARRLVVAALSTVAALLVAWLLFGPTGWLRRGGGDTVRVVDRSAEVDALMREQRRRPVADVEPILRDGVPWPGLAIPPELKAAYIERLAAKGSGWRTADPDAYYFRTAHAKRRWYFEEHPSTSWIGATNSIGMRGRMEPDDTADVRVIVTGDSHVEGVCRDEEAFPVVLGELLRATRPGQWVESFNAGVGGYGPYHYLGVLEKFVDLAPDVFVVTVFGGNDFQAAQSMWRYYTGGERNDRGPQYLKRLLAAGVEAQGLRPQELDQAIFYLVNRDQVQRSIETMVALTDRMQSICDDNGIELVAVYLPPSLRGQPHLNRDLIERIDSTLSELDDPLASSDRIADGWIDFLDERGIPTVDLRPIFRATEERLYWRTDQHINVRGQRTIAEALLPVLEELL